MNRRYVMKMSEKQGRTLVSRPTNRVEIPE